MLQHIKACPFFLAPGLEGVVINPGICFLNGEKLIFGNDFFKTFFIRKTRNAKFGIGGLVGVVKNFENTFISVNAFIAAEINILPRSPGVMARNMSVFLKSGCGFAISFSPISIRWFIKTIRTGSPLCDRYIMIIPSARMLISIEISICSAPSFWFALSQSQMIA